MTNCEDFAPLIVEAFAEGRDFVMPVKGISMLPFMSSTDKVTLTKPESIKKHDLIFYTRSNGQFVLHRVYKVKDNSFILVGDNQINLEYNINQNQVVGKVKNIIRKIGKVHRFKGFWYRFYLFIWHFLFLRRCILFVYRRIHHV